MQNPARQLFFDYLGDKFGMWHDGVLDEYKQYAIDEEQEICWRKELIALWIERLSSTDLSAVITLARLKASEALPKLIRLADQGDSYANLLFANAIWEISSISNNLPAQDFAIRMWSVIAVGPVVLAPDRGFQPLGGENPEKYIQEWAANNLKRNSTPTTPPPFITQ